MSDDEIPKPKLRGLLTTQIKRNFIGAVICTCLGGSIKYYFNLQKKKRYADFYANYDIDKEFDEMVKTGVFQSIK